MSIATELNRIIDAKADIIDSIEGKGVTVPSGKKIDELAPYIDDISGGGGTDISDADAATGDVLASKTFYSVEEPRKTGTMVDRGTVSTDISAKATEVTIAAGKHSGSGVVKIATAEQNKIIAENIKKDIAILGVTGTLESGGGGGTDPIIRYYTAGATWTKPAGLSHVLVVCIGGGGGGSSGARSAAGVISRGGGGGGAPCPMRRVITVAQLGATETITVGAGGAGGAAQTSDNSANVAGDAGGNTSFGSLVLSRGAFGGLDTGNGSPTNVITDQVPPQEAYTIHGERAGIGINSNTGGGNGGPASDVFMRSTTAGGGGGPGGSINTSNVHRAGGNGSRAYNAANTQSAVRAGGTVGGGGNDGHDNYCNQLLMAFGGMETTHGFGTSGAGGGSANAAAGGKGGNGGNYGAGGGGGGASRNGYASGAGGNGGAGLCIVMEFYGA